MSKPVPNFVPGEDPTVFIDPAPKTGGGGGELAIAADKARANPEQWVFVACTRNERGARLEWPKNVKRGEAATLGGTTERWNAKVLEVVLRDGEYIFIDLARPLRPDESVEYAKYVAYLGPRRRRVTERRRDGHVVVTTVRATEMLPDYMVIGFVEASQPEVGVSVMEIAERLDMSVERVRPMTGRPLRRGVVEPGHAVAERGRAAVRGGDDRDLTTGVS